LTAAAAAAVEAIAEHSSLKPCIDLFIGMWCGFSSSSLAVASVR